MAFFVLHSIKVGATHIPVTQSTADPQFEMLVEGAASSVENTQCSVRGTKPIITFTSPALGTALGVCGDDPLVIGSGNKIELYGALLVSGASYSDQADCVCVTVWEGMMVCNRLRGDKTSAATGEFTVFATYDGTHLPFAVSAAASIPTVTALAELYTLFGAVLDDGEVGEAYIALNDATVDFGWTTAHERDASDVYPTITAILSSKPTIQATSMDAKSIIDAVDISLGHAATNLIVYFGKLTAGGAFTAGGVHVSVTGVSGLVAITNITAPHNEVATVQIQHWPVLDSTGPIVAVTNASLPTATHTPALFTAGPLKFATTDRAHARWTLTNAYEVLHESDSGNYQAHTASYRKRNLTVDADVHNPALAITEGAAGALVLYLRKIATGGARVADATEEHIEITIAAAVMHGSTQGSWGQDMTASMKFQARYNGSDAIVAVDTTAAIT